MKEMEQLDNDTYKEMIQLEYRKDKLESFEKDSLTVHFFF